MAPSSILLKNGTVLFHEADDHVTPLRKTDLLITGKNIAMIGRSISPPAQTRVIDCTDKIISPGFIDTHHHLWQTQLKGRFSDDTFLDYTPKGNMACFAYEAEDVFWGQLAGCMEAIDAGSTFVVDHAHMGYSPEHVAHGLAATEASGLRSFFCYNFRPRIKEWDEEKIEPDMDLIPTWMSEQLSELARKKPFGDGRVDLGWAFDLLFLPKEVVVPLYEKVRELGIKLITTHMCKNAVFGQTSLPGVLDSYGLLRPDLLFSHANNTTTEEARLLKQHDIWISTTPDTENQMGLGDIECFRDDMQASLGIDCHSACTSDIVSQMRLALQLVRQTSNQALLQQGYFPADLKGRTEDVFNMGTVRGARAVHMAERVGTLAEGKLADVNIFSATSPGMVCAAEHDPVAAVVRHSSIRDIEMVIIDGVIRKENGRLLPVTVDLKTTVAETEDMEWSQVAKHLLESRALVQSKLEKLSMEAGKRMLINMWHIDTSKIVPVK